MNDIKYKVNSILWSRSINEMKRIKHEDNLFAYYTSADTALKIIQKEEIWMRNISDMNDLSEVNLGQKLLVQALKKPEILTAFSDIFDMLGTGREFFSNIVSFIENMLCIREQLYITCFSEHHKDEPFGRLSMWRAYAPQNGVVFLINASALDADLTERIFWTSPILYLPPEDISKLCAVLSNTAQKLLSLMSGQRNNIEIAQFIHEQLIGYFYVSTASIKHDIFREEQEWRVLHSTMSRKLIGDGILEKSIENVGGLPQPIYRIYLPKLYSNEPGDVPLMQKLLRKVIIGPSKNPKLIQEALCDGLREKGIVNPEKIVEISNIPLRL